MPPPTESCSSCSPAGRRLKGHRAPVRPSRLSLGTARDRVADSGAPLQPAPAPPAQLRSDRIRAALAPAEGAQAAAPADPAARAALHADRRRGARARASLDQASWGTGGTI